MRQILFKYWESVISRPWLFFFIASFLGLGVGGGGVSLMSAPQVKPEIKPAPTKEKVIQKTIIQEKCTCPDYDERFKKLERYH